MDRSEFKFTVDLLMFLDFLAVALSGFVLWLVLPRGSGRIGGSFILLRENWLFIHDWSSLLLVVLVAAHVVLNWVWIKGMLKRFLRQAKGS